MFDDEKEEWEKFFDFFKKKFNEEVGLMPGIFENDDFEVDLVIGEKSEEIYGIRILQTEEYDDEEDEEEEEDSEIDEIPTKDDDDDEDESGLYEVIQYDLVKTPISEAELKGKPLFQLEFGSELENDLENEEPIEKTLEEENDPFKIVVYSQMKDDKVEITGAVLSNTKNPDEISVFIEHAEL